MRTPLRYPILMVCLVMAIVILFTTVVYTAEGEDILTTGSKGKRVREVKNRLKIYRCLGKDRVNNNYTELTAEAVRLFQRLNNLEETGEIDEETEKLLFSDDAVYAPWPTLSPLATPCPATEPEWPERDQQGYLADDGEYFYENDDEGQWCYLSKKLQVYIRKGTDSSIPLEWFETEIYVRDGERLQTVMTNPERPATHYKYPDTIARDAGFVVGFSDDFYADRKANKQTVGIIIREGQIIYDKTNRDSSHHLPNLDMLAQYPDGSLAVYRCNEITAQELVSKGAVNVFSFGPILIRDGEINEQLYSYYRSTEPRQALGMIEPNHYFILSVCGRMKTSKGTMLQRVAEMMKNKGVTQALNLDGGNTMALVFRGRILNKKATYKRRTFYRTLTSMIGFGKTDSMSD